MPVYVTTADGALAGAEQCREEAAGVVLPDGRHLVRQECGQQWVAVWGTSPVTARTQRQTYFAGHHLNAGPMRRLARLYCQDPTLRLLHGAKASQA
jgi:hypothetical protein